MVVRPSPIDNYKNHALLDTGAIQSALSEDELRKIITAQLEAVLQTLAPTKF